MSTDTHPLTSFFCQAETSGNFYGFCYAYERNTSVNNSHYPPAKHSTRDGTRRGDENKGVWYPAPLLGDLVGRPRAGFSNYDLELSFTNCFHCSRHWTTYRVTAAVPSTAVLFPRWANGGTGLTSNCSRVLRGGRQKPASVFRLYRVTSFHEYKRLFLSLK